ncbi:MAG: hypothetical protein COA77_11230 [Thaumarchaeota archaeon]|nr:MAG: hypothetical protein COA77_11230 [Nitrososphaerota archaeon]
MTKFWIISIPIFLIIIAVIAKFTLKKFRSESDDREWRLWSGRSTYWQMVSLCSLGITTFIMFILKWVNVVTF